LRLPLFLLVGDDDAARQGIARRRDPDLEVDAVPSGGEMDEGLAVEYRRFDDLCLLNPLFELLGQRCYEEQRERQAHLQILDEVHARRVDASNRH
jgi:hypothetical protein